MNNTLQNWENFVLQSGRWNGHWLRYNCAQRRVFAEFSGIRDLPLVDPDFMDHTNHYQDVPGGPWRQRAFRGYHRSRNNLPDGISHDDLGEFSRGIFFSDSNGLFGHNELGPMGGLEIYMISGDIRFSVVLQFGISGQPGMLSYIREHRDQTNSPYWTNDTALGQSRSPVEARGVLQTAEYPSLECLTETTSYRSPYSVGADLCVSPCSSHVEYSTLHLPDAVTVVIPSELRSDQTWSISAEWLLSNGAVKAVTAIFENAKLTRVLSFTGITADPEVRPFGETEKPNGVQGYVY